MPFQSQQQAKWAFTKSGIKALGGPAKVKEWAAQTDYSKLPAKINQFQKRLKEKANVR